MPRKKWHFWTNGIEEVSIFEGDCPPDGWWLGRKPFSPETRDKARARAIARGPNNKGKKLSDEARENMSKSKQNFLKNNPDWVSPTQWKPGHQTWNKGCKMSEETKKKLSAAKKGKHLSEESRLLKTQHEYETKKKNNSFHTSRPENTFGNVLFGLFGEENVEHSYRDDRYPYNCDYYIKPLDLFIELNYHWTHGFHPYNSDDAEDAYKLKQWQKKAETSKYYSAAINVWTVRDIEKQKCAREHNLNYITIYSKEDLHDFIREMKKRFPK